MEKGIGEKFKNNDLMVLLRLWLKSSNVSCLPLHCTDKHLTFQNSTTRAE